MTNNNNAPNLPACKNFFKFLRSSDGSWHAQFFHVAVGLLGTAGNTIQRMLGLCRCMSVGLLPSYVLECFHQTSSSLILLCHLTLTLENDCKKNMNLPPAMVAPPHVPSLLHWHSPNQHRHIQPRPRTFVHFAAGTSTFRLRNIQNICRLRFANLVTLRIPSQKLGLLWLTYTAQRCSTKPSLKINGRIPSINLCLANYACDTWKSTFFHVTTTENVHTGAKPG